MVLFQHLCPPRKELVLLYFTSNGAGLWTSKAAQNTFGGGDIAATSTSGITSSKTVKLKIYHKNLFGDGTTHTMNAAAAAWHYFIYDKKTYELMDNNDSLTHVHLTFPNQSAGHQGTSSSFTTSYDKITILNPPTSKFNPSTETTNLHISTSSSNYFNNSSASNTNTEHYVNGLMVYLMDRHHQTQRTIVLLCMMENFTSPGSLRSTTYLGNGTGNYPELVTLYNHYTVDSTASSDYLGTPASHYADNYRWAFYKFVFQNSSYSAVTPVESQIFLADGNNDNNTNIAFSDLLSSEGTTDVTSSPKVKVCAKTFFAENGTTWEVSGWNQIISGPTATNPAAPSASELNNDLTIPASGNGNSNDWTNSVGKKKSGDFDELGNSGAIPSDATWKTGCRRLPFKHGKMKLNKQVKAWHIIAVGIRNDVSRYIGNVYISRKYDDSG